MTTSCPSKDCGSEERTVRNDWKIRSRAFYLRRVGGGSRGWRRRRRAWGRGMITKPIPRVTYLEIRLVQPRQRLLVRRTLREARGSRQGAGQPMGVRVAKPSNEKKQRVRPRRKRARARVSRDETKYRLPRAHLAHLCHRHRISRGLSLRDPSDLSLHRPFATDAVASCKLKVDPKTPPPPLRMARRVRCVRDRSNRALSPRSDLKGLPDRTVRFSRPSSPHPARTRAMTGSARGGGVSTKIFFNIRFERVPSQRTA